MASALLHCSDIIFVFALDSKVTSSPFPPESLWAGLNSRLTALRFTEQDSNVPVSQRHNFTGSYDGAVSGLKVH